MQTTVLSSKGQIIIPKAMRDSRHWHAGTRLAVCDTPEGLLLKPVVVDQKTPLTQGLASIRQRIAYAGPAVSIEYMNAAVLSEAARRPPR